MNLTEEQAIKKVNDYIVKHNLDSRSRKREFTYPRFYLFEYLKKNTGLTLKEIGEMFNRDHTDVIYGLNVIDTYRDDELFYSYCIDVHEKFNMPYTTIRTIDVGEIEIPPKVYKRLNYFMTKNGYDYRQAVHAILINKMS